ncbi:MAG: HEAT repeat domain-containing protein, partial [Bryobacterales bacterium]|nr:HEAT repeat domain-containing protein [Bryobacterales bacterium]
ALVLAGFGDRRGWEKLSEILHDQSVRVPRQGIAAGNFTSPSSRQIEADRDYAVHPLGARKNPRALPILAPFLKDPKVKYEIAWSLGEIGGEQVVDMLLPLLQEEDTNIRMIAMYSLGKLQVRRTLPYILPLREDNRRSSFGSQETVSEAAAKAITAMR